MVMDVVESVAATVEWLGVGNSNVYSRMALQGWRDIGQCLSVGIKKDFDV